MRMSLGMPILTVAAVKHRNFPKLFLLLFLYLCLSYINTSHTTAYCIFIWKSNLFVLCVSVRIAFESVVNVAWSSHYFINKCVSFNVCLLLLISWYVKNMSNFILYTKRILSGNTLPSCRYTCHIEQHVYTHNLPPSFFIRVILTCCLDSILVCKAASFVSYYLHLLRLSNTLYGKNTTKLNG